MTVAERIICLTEETVETLYLLGEQDRIVGITGYAVRPPAARRDKPKVSAFNSASIDKILDLKPDLVLTFSDLQADIAAELIPPRHRSPWLQPAQRRRHPRDDPDGRCNRGCDRSSRAPRRPAPGEIGRRPPP